VEILPDRHHWDGAHGVGRGDAITRLRALLSFPAHAQHLPDSTFSFDRHPTRAKSDPRASRQHETISTPAGEFQTVELEMRVGTARITTAMVSSCWARIDARTHPHRGNMPLLGVGILTLRGVTPA
jgi:hypothetical protein